MAEQRMVREEAAMHGRSVGSRLGGLVLAVVAGCMTVAGCGSTSPGGDEAQSVQSWHDVDPCALVDRSQLAKIADDPDVPPAKTSDTKSKDCKYKAVTGLTVLGIHLGDLPPTPFTTVPTYARVRGLEADRRLVVTYEEGGYCTVTLADAPYELEIAIAPDADKTTVALGDKSHASCDVQLPLINSILDKVNVK